MSDIEDDIPAHDYIEDLFVRVLQEKGGPSSHAHVSAAVDGFTVGPDEELLGHTNDAIALSFITTGYTIIKLPAEDEESALFKDPEGLYMNFTYLTRDGCSQLIQDLSEILSEEG